MNVRYANLLAIVAVGALACAPALKILKTGRDIVNNLPEPCEECSLDPNPEECRLEIGCPVPRATPEVHPRPIPRATGTPSSTASPVPTTTATPIGCDQQPPTVWRINGFSHCASFLPKRYKGDEACGLDGTWWYACSNPPRAPVDSRGRTYAPTCDLGHRNNNPFMQQCCGGREWLQDERGIDYKVIGPCVKQTIKPLCGMKDGKEICNEWQALVVLLPGCKGEITVTGSIPENPVDQECHHQYKVLQPSRTVTFIPWDKK